MRGSSNSNSESFPSAVLYGLATLKVSFVFIIASVRGAMIPVSAWSKPTVHHGAPLDDTLEYWSVVASGGLPVLPKELPEHRRLSSIARDFY